MMIAFASLSYPSIRTSVSVRGDFTAFRCEIADTVALSDSTFIFSSHSGRIAAPEDPYLLTLVHEDVSEGKTEAPLHGIAVIHELRKEKVHSEGNAALFYSKLAVSLCREDVPDGVPGIKAADVYDGTVFSAFLLASLGICFPGGVPSVGAFLTGAFGEDGSGGRVVVSL